MREAFYGVITDYKEFIGTSHILLLFFVALLALIFINNNESSDGRRRLNPTVFLLSLWSGVAYTVVSMISLISEDDNIDEKEKKNNKLLAVIKRISIAVFAFVAIALSGNFVISEEAYKSSIYYFSGNNITILSAISIVIYFIVYYLISRQLFSKKGNRTLFMGAVLILHLFGFYSEKAAAYSLILSPITVQSIIVHDIMPLLLWLYLVYEEQIKEKLSEDEIQDATDSEDYEEEWDMKKHKILNMRNMAIAFLVLVVAVLGSVFVLNKKINTLYDATVVLENAAKSKMTVCELTDESANVYLTIMISPDGNTTVLGGADASKGTDCYEFITKNTDKVDKWYLYDDSEAGKGAYDYCIDNGLSVDETFVISGINKID